MSCAQRQPLALARLVSTRPCNGLAPPRMNQNQVTARGDAHGGPGSPGSSSALGITASALWQRARTSCRASTIGISSTTITYLLHGQMPHTDFYEPYGIGFGVPGLLPRIAGLEGIFAERLTYGVFPALVTVLATVFVWKRCGPFLGILVGLLTLSSNVARVIRWLGRLCSRSRCSSIWPYVGRPAKTCVRPPRSRAPC